MANQDRVNFVWAESALTTIPPIPVSEVAYRDTTQTPEQMEVGQQYDTIYNSARHNQLLFLLTSVAKTLCENGIMPFLAGQEYSQYARCIFTDGKLYTASRAILANEQPYPTPGDDSGVWIAEETSENFVPNSRRVIAGTGLTGGGPLSSDVTLSAKLDGKTTQAAADGAITVKDVAIGGDLGDLASARSLTAKFIKGLGSVDCNTIAENMIASVYQAGTTNGPGFASVLLSFFSSAVMGVQAAFTTNSSTIVRASLRSKSANGYSPWSDFLMSGRVGDGIEVNNGIPSVPEMQGATASTAGTSGLVPPATAGQQESFLTGGGEYKPALTKISDSVSLADSTTAASAKAVKAAYDLASSKLSISGGTLTGALITKEGVKSFRNIDLLSNDDNGLAIAFYNASMDSLLSSLRFKNNEVYVEKGRLGADGGIFSRGNINLRTNDTDGLALALQDLNGAALYNSIRLKKDGTVVFEFQPLAVSQGGTGARTVDAARANLFVPSIPTNAEGPGLFLIIEIASHTSVLKPGGTWAYSVYAVNASRSIIGTLGGIAAGGSSIYYAEASALFGWCWRVR